MLAWRVAITRTSVARETTRRMARFDLHLGSEIRRLRLDAGLSLTALGQVVGVHRSHLARIEAGTARASLELLHAIAVALGAELSVRYFAGIGPRLHDRTQAVMVESLLRTLDRRWRVELEVPVFDRHGGWPTSCCPTPRHRRWSSGRCSRNFDASSSRSDG